jgi:hypothetical protein
MGRGNREICAIVVHIVLLIAMKVARHGLPLILAAHSQERLARPVHCRASSWPGMAPSVCGEERCRRRGVQGPGSRQGGQRGGHHPGVRGHDLARSGSRHSSARRGRRDALLDKGAQLGPAYVMETPKDVPTERDRCPGDGLLPVEVVSTLTGATLFRALYRSTVRESSCVAALEDVLE